MSELQSTLDKLDAVINADGTDEAVKAALQGARTSAIKSEIVRLQDALKKAKALLPQKALSPKQQALKEKREAARAAKEAAKDAAKKK